jgi:hypothetical protein
MPITPEVEVLPKPSSSAIPDPKTFINLDDLPAPLAIASAEVSSGS